MRPDDLHNEQDVAAWLTGSRPLPQDDFVDGLEHQLVGRRAFHRSRPRVLAAGLGLSGALAAVVVLAALMGGGPLQTDRGDAEAGKECRTLHVRTTEKEGLVVANPDGEPRVVTVERPVTREVKRCR